MTKINKLTTMTQDEFDNHIDEFADSLMEAALKSNEEFVERDGQPTAEEEICMANVRSYLGVPDIRTDHQAGKEYFRDAAKKIFEG